MNRLNQKKGFTLIEIIVVLIIVGVLASIALPNLFQNIAKSKGAEALAQMGAMKSTIEACVQRNGGDSTNCATLTALGLISAQGSFSYVLSVSTSAGVWSLVASYNGLPSGVVSFSRTSSGAVTCTTTGAFAGVC